ncbi:MAG TPA: hypothetical protein VK668_00165 [Mucilaginibacter sp.]|nr:hypothetical protein [Mucilaginibacter sp.]
MYTLITAANSSQAYKLKTKLNSDHILLGDYLELPDLLVQSGKMLKLPNPQTIAYTHEMLALCLDRSIDTVYALRKQEQQLLLEAAQLFSEYDIKIQVAEDEI